MEEDGKGLGAVPTEVLLMWWYLIHWIGLALSILAALLGKPVGWLSAGVFFLILMTWDT